METVIETIKPNTQYDLPLLQPAGDLYRQSKSWLTWSGNDFVTVLKNLL